MIQVTDPIVIAGCWRSGTTLLRSILRAHPAIYGPPNETSYLRAILQRYPEQVDDVNTALALLCSHNNYPSKRHPADSLMQSLGHASSMPTDEFLQRLFAGFLQDMPQKNLLLKDPVGSQRIPQLSKLLPGMRVVHISRDPRAMVNSQLRKWPSSSQHNGIRLWKNVLEIGQQWGAMHPGRYVHLRYEDLVGSPESELAKVCKMLEIPYTDDLLNFRQPNEFEGNASGVDKTRAEAWRHQLSSERVHWIEAKCGEGMKQLKYVSSQPTYSRIAYAKLRSSDRMMRVKQHAAQLVRSRGSLVL